QNPNSSEGRESTEMPRCEGKQIQQEPEQALVRHHVEEKTVTMTRGEMQKMITEEVAAQLKHAQVERPRVERPRVEQPRVEQPRSSLMSSEHQAQSNERPNRLAEEEASSIRTVNPQARDETLEQLNSLAKRPGRTFDEVLRRCAKYINVEEAEADFLHMARVIKTDSRDERRERKSSSTGERKRSPRAEKKGRPRSWRPTQYTPLAVPQARILEVMEREIRDDVVRWSKTRNDGPTKPKSNLYSKALVRGRSEEFPPKRGVIHMIFGGPTDGDSNRARKAYARGRYHKVEVQQVNEEGPVMNFGPADVGEVERPHNDALMITVQVSGCEVQRIFVDTGSSINVIFYDCLKWMELDLELTPLHTSLFGFNGSKVAPLGETTLVVVLGEDDLKKVKMVRFVVVDVESTYNVILGRPGLNAFQAVVSTYHMKLKFLVGDS
ncbi:Unknown protein, partial [Striga hermonthica]